MTLPYEPIEGANHLIQCPYGWVLNSNVGCDEALQMLCKRECKTSKAKEAQQCLNQKDS